MFLGLSTHEGRFQHVDLERPPWCYLLWGVPAAIAGVTSYAYGASYLSVTEAGALWTLAVAWAGIGCFINGRLCGRVHCKVDGILFPALSVVGALNVLSLISITWTEFWATFLVILLAGFASELYWGRYSLKRPESPLSVASRPQP